MKNKFSAAIVAATFVLVLAQSPAAASCTNNVGTTACGDTYLTQIGRAGVSQAEDVPAGNYDVPLGVGNWGGGGAAPVDQLVEPTSAGAPAFSEDALTVLAVLAAIVGIPFILWLAFGKKKRK